MKKILLLIVSVCCLPFAMQAQQDDSKYLAGAVPEVDGKVVFTREFSIPGMPKDEIYNRTMQWMEAALKENGNNSRVVYSDEQEGIIIGTGDEWIVFSSSALSLDRTRILYQLTVDCQPERCTMQVGKVRYIYREGQEKYTAEEWITDKYALNKAQTKLVRGLAKWRRKTIDFVDNTAAELANALSETAVQAQPEAEAAQPSNNAQQGTIVVNPRTTVIPVAGEQPAANPVAVRDNAAQTPAGTLKEVAPDQLSTDLIQMGGGRLVIVIGNDAFNMTTMTANAGGSLGRMQGKTVIFTLLSPDQPHEAMDKAAAYAVRYYPAGEEKPAIILQCKQLPAQEPLEGQPRMYIGEITKAMVAE